MIFKVTAVAMNRKTREQVGDIRTEVINTETNSIFKHCYSPINVEICYQSFWNNLNGETREIVKVIGVKQV